MRRRGLVIVGLLVIAAAEAAAQTGPSASSVGVNSNVNRLSTGSNRNTNANANSNSQFLSGSNTGVNNGSLEIYSGADPYQGIVLEGSVDLPQLPGLVPSPNNFSQPYRPETFVNTPAFLPAEMTLAEASRCRDSKVSWYGGARSEAPSIRLLYAAKQETPAAPLTMAHYVGTAMAVTSDGPFIAALCEAAYRAMRKGASVGVVDFTIRPKNTMFGIGYGASGGATGLPAAGAHPYAIAGTLGFGTGWSSQRVEGEVLVQLTALRYPDGIPVSAAEAGGPNGARETAALPGPETAPIPATEPEASQPGDHGTAASPAWSATDTHAPAASPSGPALTVTYHSAERLDGVRRGQSKERVFDLFGTAVVRRQGELLQVEGIQLHAVRRSDRATRLEVGAVTLSEPRGQRVRYWFLFEDGRLVAWGPPGQWGATAQRYRLDGLDGPGTVSESREANARVVSRD